MMPISLRLAPTVRALPPVLAAGAWFNNAVCATRNGEARLSRVVGDLNTSQACISHDEETAEMLQWMGQPAAVAHDLHPDFYSSRHAVELAARLGVPAIPVQHHHAHIAAVCAEHGHSGPVIGLALDGVGLGSDGTPWGGELLHVDGARFQRLGYLAPLALPGGDRAAREPWRMAAAVLHDLGRSSEIAGRFPDEAAVPTVLAMLERGFNCPRTSSAGRLFDAASALLGLCLKINLDAEAAIKLEQAARRRIDSGGWPEAQVGGWQISDNGVLDLRLLLAQLADEPDIDYGAALFHATLVAALAEWAERACGAANIATVALGGGCFFNQLLTRGLRTQLEACGLTVLTPEQLVPGDAGLAVGQAWVALHSLES